MNITAPTIKKIIDIEKQEKITDNKLLLMALTINTAKSTAFKEIKENIFNQEKEFDFLISLLNQHNLLTKNDLSNIQKLNKTKIIKRKNFKNEVEEIINHLSLATNSNLRITDNKTKLIEKWLDKGYSVNDFKIVNSYFSHIWNTPEMENYIRETTLYNSKFPERVEEAEKAFNKFEKFEKELFDICKIYEAYFLEYVVRNKTNIKQALLIDKNTYCKSLSFTAKKRISFWLSKNYSKEELIKTLIITIVSWSQKEELREHISIEKIFDNKFEQRLNIAKIKQIPFVKENKSKKVLKEWYQQRLEKEKLLNQDNEVKTIYNESTIIEAEISEDDDSFVKSIFKKMKLW